MGGSTATPFGDGTYIPDTLAQFLGRVVPWSLADPPDSYVNIHAWGGMPGREFRGGGRAYGSMAEYVQLQNFVGFLNRSQADVFFCLSSQRHFADVRWRQGSPTLNHRRALRNYENAVMLKAFVLDLDVKRDAYASQHDALAALLTFCQNLNLELGPVVSSGYGIHAYIVLQQAITLALWMPLATQLRAASQQAGLKCDFKVTVNAVTLLRLPTSWNYKDKNNPRECRVLDPGIDTTIEKLSRALESYPATSEVNIGGTRRAGLDPQIFPRRPPITGPEHERVMHDLERSRIVVSGEDLYRACPVFADSCNRRGDGDLEVLWYELAKLLHYVENGEQIFHEISRGDERYEVENVTKKYRAQNPMGWPACQTIAETSGAAAAICRTCPFNGQGKSPIHFALRGLGAPSTKPINGHATANAFVKASPIVLTLPDGYVQDPDQYIIRLADGARVFQVPVVALDHMKEIVAANQEKHSFVLQMPESSVEVSWSAIQTQNNWAETLYGHGAIFNDKPLVKGFLMSWIEKVQKAGRVSARGMQGWAKEKFDQGFIYDHMHYSAQGDVQISSRSAVNGDLEKWKEAAAHLIGKGYVEHETLIAASFSGPLILATGVTGFVVFGRSLESGTGKSTALHEGATVWGPRTTIVQATTANAVPANLARARHIPVFYDEFVQSVGPEDRRRFSDLTLQVSSGQEKARLDRGAHERPRRTWCTTMIAVANPSMVEATSRNETNAQAARMLEFNVPMLKGISQGLWAQNQRMLEDNCGTAGHVYARFLGHHGPAVQQLVDQQMTEFQYELGGRPEERFWVAGITAIYVGAAIAKRLNLLAFDLVSMRKFLLDTVRAQRQAIMTLGISVDDPGELMSRLTEFLVANTIKQVKTPHLPIQGRHLGSTVPIPARAPDSYVVRMAVVDGKMWISKSAFRNWCDSKREYNYNFRSMLTGFRKYFGMLDGRNKRGRITGQIRNVPEQPQEDVLEFDLTRPDLQHLLPSSAMTQ